MPRPSSFDPEAPGGMDVLVTIPLVQRDLEVAVVAALTEKTGRHPRDRPEALKVASVSFGRPPLTTRGPCVQPVAPLTLGLPSGLDQTSAPSAGGARERRGGTGGADETRLGRGHWPYFLFEIGGFHHFLL